jgi:hypothetical protein
MSVAALCLAGAEGTEAACGEKSGAAADAITPGGGRDCRNRSVTGGTLPDHSHGRGCRGSSGSLAQYAQAGARARDRTIRHVSRATAVA